MTDKAKTGWNFENSYARLSDIFFANTNPTPVREPELVLFNETLASSLGLDGQALQQGGGVSILAGNEIPQGAMPIAQAYAGHQFGHFTMLGDGRAVLLGEQITPQEERIDIQLKGSGRTPFSRGGDGRATLGPMLREYIISEAMHALGIPTNRSLAVVTTGESVMRETALPGAILTRVASSHLRVGTFQYARKWGTKEQLQALADYAIERHFPHLVKDVERYRLFLREVSDRQAKLIANWQLVGFIHGVMNTDNMTISGETIDYGPCAFMNTYDPNTVFSSIDAQGRYAYGHQPRIGGWNLARFAEALLPLLHENQDQAVEIAQDEVARYLQVHHNYWLTGIRAKLGISNQEEEDEGLIEDLLQLMEDSGSDYTNTFRALTFDQYDEMALFNTNEFADWKKQWQARLERQAQSKQAIHELMRNSNPAVIPRNHRVEEALEAAVENDDYSVLKQLLDVLSRPYAHSADQREYCSPPPATDVPYRTYCGT
ncbi:protein adenylyltransferase SelO [Aquibacillus sediminis]|uniref:protein adenylyltransferase SelO n=1 Tax=Aquibacillus sediminis TaxID=2574734 RepID=UPI001108325C|nr:YdiU family protein [Aquibacillus sediminis]